MASGRSTVTIAFWCNMAKKWIQKAIKKPGSLTETAKRHGMTVNQFISNPPKGISSTTKRRIALAKTLKKMGKKDGK